MQYIQFVDLKEAYRKQQLGYEAAEADRVARLRGRSDDDWLTDLKIVWSVREPGSNYFHTAALLQSALRDASISFCFIGGLAVQRWGEVRRTTDIDLTVICDLGQESEMLEKLTAILSPRVDDIEWLVKNARMYLGIFDETTEIDISLGYTHYEKRVMERAVDVNFGIEESLRCCSAEDLVILKTTAGRGQDWVDIRRIIQVSGREIDWELVFTELKMLLEMIEKPEAEQQLRELLDREL